MRIDILTLFPDMCERVMGESIIGRAQAAGKIEVNCHQIRDYSPDKHRRTDDTLYGGGKGMLMTAEPIYRCWEAVTQGESPRPHLIYMTPKGKLLTQARVAELAQLPRIGILCGHYEGVDQRLIDELVDEQLSIGDYVLTGGELPALVLADGVARLCEGVLSDQSCWQEESLAADGLLEAPHYTKPFDWRGRCVPEILITGHHANIERWRREQSLLTTVKNRPDLMEKATLTARDRLFLAGYFSAIENDEGRAAK
ncbi:MAG: tRNA (guanosine(37)-N1)-methyltransferase TrmD [Oscillospiraceae bacterium]|nr:tRNA (guanosine(37)-N1)-methyltransferase TrmD [Oscillospiraceae bacterium]